MPPLHRTETKKSEDAQPAQAQASATTSNPCARHRPFDRECRRRQGFRNSNLSSDRGSGRCGAGTLTREL